MPAAALAVAGFGVGAGMAGHLHQSLSSAVTDRFRQQVTFRVGFAEELGEGLGDDETGFGIEPAIDPPTPIKGFRQVQMLTGPLLRRSIS